MIFYLICVLTMGYLQAHYRYFYRFLNIKKAILGLSPLLNLGVNLRPYIFFCLFLLYLAIILMDSRYNYVGTHTDCWLWFNSLSPIN